jgi:hypothetical protein
MERDAPASAPALDVVPPVAWETARKVGLVGLGLVAAAAALGLVTTAVGDSTPWPLHTARLWLVLVGAVAAGFAVSQRPDLWRTWGIGAVAALVAVAGVPAHWDSFRLLFVVLTIVASLGAVLMAVPRVWRLRVVSLLIVLHFGGILTATTTPPPTPWLTEQLYHRVYNPYLQFVYLRNAYHFYSPEPGPASILACLIKTETGEQVGADGVRRKTYQYQWVVLPKRPGDVRDPLGLTYYRRLSITEQVARAYPEFMLQRTFEQSEVSDAREQRTYPGADPRIPMHPDEAPFLQYRLPTPDIMRYLLPSYAQHLIMEHAPVQDVADPDEQDRVRKKTTVKIYRIEHRTLNVEEFRRGVSPYHPTTYKPYFLGEFNVFGELVDPHDSMLYWLVPIIGRPTGPAPGDPDRKDYDDHLSAHAGYKFDWSQLR